MYYQSRSILIFVGNKSKGECQYGCFTKTKHAQFSEKTNISYPLIRTRASAYQGVKMFISSENLACLVLACITAKHAKTFYEDLNRPYKILRGKTWWSQFNLNLTLGINGLIKFVPRLS